MCCKCCLDNSLRVEHRAVPRFSLTRVKSEAQVPVSLRVVSEARRAMRLHEHGVLDHFGGDRCITGMPAVAWKQPCAWLAL